MRVHRRLPASGGGGETDFAAQFAGAEKLVAANAGAFSPANGTDWTVGFWFVIDEFPVAGVHEICNVTGNALALDGWFVFVDSAQTLAMGYSNGAGYQVLAPATIDAATWYFCKLHWNNDASPSLNMSLYDTESSINSWGAGTTGFINIATPQPLNLGGGIAPQAWMRGRIDKWGCWARNFAGGEEADLWAAGAGLTGEQVDAHGTLSDYVAYYDLDELTGAATWPDQGGNHPATATGTVVRVPKAGQF
jgi:hypothetical protein